MNPDLIIENAVNIEWLTILCWTIVMLSVGVIAATMCVHAYLTKEQSELFHELDCRLQ
jgi:hypothetical protein